MAVRATHAFPVSPKDLDQSDMNMENIKTEYQHHTHTNAPNTPPTTDEGSHKDDDAASSSSLSELDDDIDLDVTMDAFDEEDNRQRFEDAARAGAEAEKDASIKPHHFEGGIPVFVPTMDEFRGE